ncbi:MAG: FecR domain-containing protein [Anaerolineae bacterium]
MSIGVWVRRMIVLHALAIGLAACTEPVSLAQNDALSLTLLEGQASWLTVDDQKSTPLSATVSVGWEDEISSRPDQGAVVRLADNSVIRMRLDTRLKIRRPYGSDTRPVIRLLRGAVHVSAQSAGFVVESYREVPHSLRIVLVNMVLEPQGSFSDFELAFDADTATARVNSGQVEVSATDIRGMLMAEWRAELAPDQALRIIPPYTPTPLFGPTPSATLIGIPTWTWTPTATATPSKTPTRTATAVIAPTNTPEPPADTPEPPTNTPEPPPPPTETPEPPAPTDTPEPTRRPAP